MGYSEISVLEAQDSEVEIRENVLTGHKFTNLLKSVSP